MEYSAKVEILKFRAPMIPHMGVTWGKTGGKV